MSIGHVEWSLCVALELMTEAMWKVSQVQSLQAMFDERSIQQLGTIRRFREECG
jgi:hypothetical protein